MDAELDVPDRATNPPFKTAFPYDELAAMAWSSNHYAVKDGILDGGAYESSPRPWLEGYWPLTYFGVIAQ